MLSGVLGELEATEHLNSIQLVISQSRQSKYISKADYNIIFINLFSLHNSCIVHKYNHIYDMTVI